MKRLLVVGFVICSMLVAVVASPAVAAPTGPQGTITIISDISPDGEYTMTFTGDLGNFDITDDDIVATAETFTEIQWVGTTDVKEHPYWIGEGQSVVIDGKWYVFGGWDATKSCCTPTDRVFVFDPITNTWEALASMPTAHPELPHGGLTHGGFTTDGEDVFYAGGYTTSRPGTGQIFGTDQVWQYDVSEDDYIQLPDLPIDRAAGHLAYLDGYLYYTGGTNKARTEDTDEHWRLQIHPTVGSAWEERASLPNPRNHPGIATLDGYVYFLGGQHDHDGKLVPQADVHRYDPNTDTWEQMADMPLPLNHTTSSIFVYNGRILVFGGQMNHGVGTNFVGAYDPDTDQWTELTELPQKRHSGIAAIIDDIFYYTGGSTSGEGRGKTVFVGTPVFESNIETFTPIEIGTYEVTGNIPEGFVVTNITCTGDEDEGTIITGDTVQVDLDEDEHIVCTFEAEPDNEAPLITGNNPTTREVTVGETLNVNLMIDDTDGDDLDITIDSSPDASSFTNVSVTPGEPGSYTAALSFSPQMGDEGSYDIRVMAEDAFEASDATFTLNVVAEPEVETPSPTEVTPTETTPTPTPEVTPTETTPTPTPEVTPTPTPEDPGTGGGDGNLLDNPSFENGLSEVDWVLRASGGNGDGRMQPPAAYQFEGDYVMLFVTNGALEGARQTVENVSGQAGDVVNLDYSIGNLRLQSGGIVGVRITLLNDGSTVGKRLCAVQAEGTQLWRSAPTCSIIAGAAYDAIMVEFGSKGVPGGYLAFDGFALTID